MALTVVVANVPKTELQTALRSSSCEIDGITSKRAGVVHNAGWGLLRREKCLKSEGT